MLKHVDRSSNRKLKIALIGLVYLYKGGTDVPCTCKKHKTIDYYISNDVFEHISDYKKAYEEVYMLYRFSTDKAYLGYNVFLFEAKKGKGRLQGEMGNGNNANTI